MPLAGLLLAAPAAFAAPPSSEQCLTCHVNRDLTRSAPGRSRSVYVDAARLQGSAHARLQCVACHRDAVSEAHAERLAPVNCASCHLAPADRLRHGVHGVAREGGPSCKVCHGTHDVAPAARIGLGSCASCHATEVADYQASVHGVAIAHGDAEASTCRDCHGSAHTSRSHLDSLASTNRAHLAKTCARCHADRELVIRRKITIPEAYALYAQSVHGRSRNPRAATCNDCHESHRLKRATDPTSSIYRARIPETCGRCHPSQQRAYQTGIHGTALERGVTAAPTCTDCHGEHLIRGPRDPGSPVLASAVTTTCSRCHDAEGIRQTYGLPAGRLSTYQDSFHGLAARGGSPAVANCASCHGYHDILPSSDPRSAVSRQRLAITCGKCHPGAGDRVLAGPVHVPMTTPANPILYWVRLLYLALIAGTIGGMALHNGLDYARKIRRHMARYAADGGRRPFAAPLHEAHPAADLPSAGGLGRWYLRMTFSERIQHILLAVSFFTLVYTGFALKFPEAWPFAWLARLEQGYAWRSVIHRTAAVIMVLASLIHVAYLFTARGRRMLLDMLPRIQDARDALLNLLYLVGIRSTPPDFDRFGYIEKAEYWALIWGTVVMTLTGLALWFANQSLRWLDKWVLDLVTIVHYYEAWLAFLAIVVWHIYQNVLNPDVYPMNWSWITGWVPEEQLRHEHHLEWSRLMTAERAEAAREEPAPAEPEPGKPE